MLRKINCHDLTLNSYANLGQHKIKLDHKAKFLPISQQIRSLSLEMSPTVTKFGAVY